MKSRIWTFFSTAAVMSFVAASSAHAGWIEKDDAGPFYQGGAFQQTVGLGDLDTISGSTTIPGGVIPGETHFRELVDVYSIRITDPESFYATTDLRFDARASASSDSRLFLLNPATGDVLLMNDDTGPEDGNPEHLASLIASPSTYTTLTGNSVHESAQSVELVAGQHYLLAVAEFAMTALDLTGVSGDFETGNPLSADNAYAGPPEDPLNTNGGGVVGGNKALVGSIRPATDDSDWGSNLQFEDEVEDGINYVVALQGATYAVVPEPGTLAMGLLLVLAGAAVSMRRKLG